MTTDLPSPRGVGRPSRSAPSAGRRAFTLVELVVAVAVAAVVAAGAAVALASGHGLFARLVARGRETDSALERLAAFEALRADLGCALPEGFRADRSGFSALRLWPVAGAETIRSPSGGTAWTSASSGRAAGMAAAAPAFVLASVDWGRAPDGGVRRLVRHGAAVLRDDRFPSAWGPLSFAWVAAAPVPPRPGAPRPPAAPEELPGIVPLAFEERDEWKAAPPPPARPEEPPAPVAGGAPSAVPAGPPLPVLARVRWGARSFDLPLACAGLPSPEDTP